MKKVYTAKVRNAHNSKLSKMPKDRFSVEDKTGEVKRVKILVHTDWLFDYSSDKYRGRDR